MAKRALVPIADGSEDIEAVCIIDTLRRAEVDVTVASVTSTCAITNPPPPSRAEVDVTVASVTGALEIVASRKTKIVADTLMEDCADEVYDLIVLPGGIPGAEYLRDSAVLIEKLKAQREAGRLYGAICASPAVALLPHGLLAGRTATCFPSYRARLAEAEGVQASDDRVVVDGNLVTSQGPGTAIEFALQLVALLAGDADKAQAIGRRMLVKD